MKNTNNPWSTEDEKEHYPTVLEWWCTEGFLTSKKTDRIWSFKGSFSEWCTVDKQHGSSYDFTLFDLKEKKHFSYFIRSETEKLAVSYDEEKRIHTRFDTAFLTGSYPDYILQYENKPDAITLGLQYHAESHPHWITQDITGGYLPMGFGFYRYGFIPRNHIKGTLSIQQETIPVDGTGYYEHVWGDFSYKHPIANLSFLKKSLSIYQKLVAWWIHHHTLKIPNTIKFLSENNPLGYDWVWAVLNNGWSMFLGNILFWVAEGPIFGTLILTKDGKHYQEFCNVTYRYNATTKSKNHDFIYPTSIEIIAKHNNETLHITCTASMPSREFVTPLNQQKWIAFVICEAPGTITGTYTDNKTTIPLKGRCKIEPQRQISIYGHNALSLHFIKPPKGVGIHIDLESHYLRKRISSTIACTPFPKVSFTNKKIIEP